MKVNDIIRELEQWAPPALQEEYDNSGLLCGDPEAEVTSALVSLDLTDDILEEADEKGCTLVISHHPFLFRPVRRVVAGTPVYRILSKALSKGISLYAMHTNVDNLYSGLNRVLTQKLDLTDVRILQPKKEMLLKLVTFCPPSHADQVRIALFEAGAGHIGNYDQCSYNLQGKGSFRGSDETHPFAGQKNMLHFEEETRIEVIVPAYLERQVVSAMKKNHPYEEVAYDLYPLANAFEQAGAGMVGNLKGPLSSQSFLERVASLFRLPVLRHSPVIKDNVSRIALCSGSGAFLAKDAILAGADVFLTADLKYHDFQDAGNTLVLADIGHFESEVWVKELFRDVLIEKFPTFAVLISEREVNPVRYLINQ